MSFDSLKEKVVGKTQAPSYEGPYIFTHGGFTSTYLSDSTYIMSDSFGNGFPFLEAQDPFTYNSSGSLRFLLSGKPLPGDPATNYRSIFPFVEKITLKFQDANGGPASSSTAVRVRVEYEVWWINEFTRSTQLVDTGDFEKLGAITFEFIKYDPSLY
jgi:hypothetical protein